MKCSNCGQEGINVETVVVGEMGAKVPMCPGCVHRRLELLAPPRKPKSKAAFASDEADDEE